MPPPTNHYLTLINWFGDAITASVVYVNDLGDGRVEVHIETDCDIEADYPRPVTYNAPGDAIKGHYTVTGREAITGETCIYRGIFERASGS